MAPDGFQPHMSGYWVNPATGFFFDTKTSFYFVFDAPTQRFLFWDYNERRYRVYPPTSFDESNSSSAPTAEVAATETPTAAAAASAASTAAAPIEYKAGSKPLKMMFGAKKAATNMAQWSRMKELDAAAQAAAPPLVLDAFVKATEEDESAVAAAEAEAARRRVRHQGRAPVADTATQARPVSTIFSSLGRGPKNPTAASVPTALAEPALAPPVLLTAASVVELTSTRGAVGKYETLTSLASGNVACTLCLRQFAARDKAERHVELSQLHASNAEARDNATREAVALLAERARQRELRQAEDRRTVRLREKEARDEMLAVERRLSERAAAKAAAAGSGSAQYDAMGPQIGEDNVGNKLLRKMGWREGSGLGAQGSGIVVPVQASGVAGNNKAGLGSAQSSSSSSRFGIDDERQRQLEQAFFGKD
jgi:RNA-binding protein 5/10